MSAAADIAAATRDLAAFDGELISVAGRNVRAHFREDASEQAADEYGADDRRDTATATFEWSGDLNYSDTVRARGKRWQIEGIQTDHGTASLTLIHDR